MNEGGYIQNELKKKNIVFLFQPIEISFDLIERRKI